MMACLMVLGWVALAASGSRLAADEPRPSVAELIAKAGNTEDDAERWRAMRSLAEHPELPEAQRRELATLLPVADWWANGRAKWLAGERWPGAGPRAAENGYLAGWFHGKLRPGDAYPGAVPADSPLHALWCLYRGRMLIAEPIQSMGLRDDPTWNEEGRRLLATAAKAFPDNRIPGMYLGRPIPWPALEPDPQAPAWANLQRECLDKLAEIVRWWIEHRQLPDGQFGGGWGDDCEMWRWWTPVLIGFEDPAMVAAQRRLCEAIWAQPHMTGGYTSHMDDVEHTSEDSADTITPMLLLTPDDPTWRARALRLAELMRARWTGKNQRGGLMFKSTYFTADAVDETPARACDTVWHPLAVGPALLLWLRGDEPGLGELFGPWMDTWVDAAAGSERGKPAGIVPSAIHWPSGRPGGVAPQWWKPGNYTTALYDWPAALPRLTDTLLLAWHRTADPRYLAPLRAMAQLRREHLAQPPAEPPEPGSAAWCAGQLHALTPTLAKYRLLTGQTEFDDLLRRDADGYIRFRLDHDRPALEQDLLRTATALRRNRPAFTTEVRWTDRVLAFTRTYESRFPDAPPPVDWSLLLGMVTGSTGDPRVFPLNSVRWLTPARDLAVLVTDSRTDRFDAELYHFGPDPRPLEAELFLLEAGRYTVELLAADQAIHPTRSFAVTTDTARVAFELPPRRLCVLRLRREGR